MRWPSWLLATAVILGLGLLLVAVIRPDVGPAPAKVVVNRMPARATPPPVPSSQGPAIAELPPRITVHGVLSQGRDSFSQALLDVDDGPQQLYRIGEPVAQGWSLQAIQSDHVILAKGAARATITMAGASSSGVASAGQGQSPSESASAAAAQAQTPLPGFVPGPPPRVATGDAAAASARNRSFLQAVQSGMKARARQQ